MFRYGTNMIHATSNLLQYKYTKKNTFIIHTINNPTQKQQSCFQFQTLLQSQSHSVSQSQPILTIKHQNTDPNTDYIASKLQININQTQRQTETNNIKNEHFLGLFA